MISVMPKMMESEMPNFIELTAEEKQVVADREFKRMYGPMKFRAGANQVPKAAKVKKKAKRKMAKASRRKNK